MTSTLGPSFLPVPAVLVVHGPTGASLTALRRLDQLIGDPARVLVVAGTEPGITAAERAAERGHHTPGGHGPEPLTQVLRALSGPVLVIHDDVEITAATATNLVAEHLRSGRVAIPSAASRMQPLAVDSTNLVCAVGDADALAELAAQSGFGPGYTAAGDFVEAARATMDHSGDCQRRMTDAARSGRPVLVAAMIVRDEAEHLPDCLASLRGVVDRIEVADTGSTDDTVHIARAAGANVIEIDWRDDFAWARNHVLEQCLDADYMLWIDADERLSCDDPAALRDLLATYHDLYHAYTLTIRNLTDDGVETHNFAARRIVNPTLARFEGALHEQPRRIDGQPLVTAHLSALHLDHLGYAARVMTERDKMARNLRIAEEAYSSDPSVASAVHLARSLKSASTNPAETLRQIERLRPHLVEAPKPVQALMHGIDAELNLLMGDLDRALAHAREAVDLVPADATAGAVLAEALVRSGRFAEALETADELGARRSPTPLVDDLVARRSRAGALFVASVQLGDFERAQGLLDQLPGEIDPWAMLAPSLDIAELAGYATQAGARTDTRFFDALVARADLTTAELDRAVEAYESAGGSTTPTAHLIRSARAALRALDEAPGRRDRYARTGMTEDAIAYAEAAATGFRELALALSPLADHPHGAALALAVAAEANERRGRQSTALIDAGEAIARWTGASRAAAVIARAALDDGDISGALEATSLPGDDHASLPRRERHVLSVLRSTAHVAQGDVPSAVGALLEVVEERGDVTIWPQLLEACGEDLERFSLVLGLALLTDGVRFIEDMAATLAPARTAEVCGAYLAAGGDNPDAVTTGVLAASLTGRIDLGLVIADHGHLLPGEIRARLCTHLDDAGAAALAERLAAVPANV